MAKSVTREQAARKKDQAAAFMERIGQPARASEFAGMTVDEYAGHKGLRIANPLRRHRNQGGKTMPATTKSDLQEQIDEAIEILEDVYAPESSREELAEAVGKALDVLQGEEAEEEDEDEESDDDNGGDED